MYFTDHHSEVFHKIRKQCNTKVCPQYILRYAIYRVKDVFLIKLESYFERNYIA
jgi:hypothetical protein